MSIPGTEQPRLSRTEEQRLRLIVDSHFDFVWRSLRALGVPPANADDAAQRVFLIAAQKLSSITVGSEKAFLFATVRGVAANARRSQQRRRESYDEVALGQAADEANDPEQALMDKQAKQLLEQVLEAMPDDLRNVFVLHELEGLTTTTIAEVLEIPSGTVASRLRRAREEFRLSVTRLRLQRD